MADEVVRVTRPSGADRWDDGAMEAQHDLQDLIGEWLDWKGVAGELGVSVGKVRTMIREHQLAAVGPRVPAELLMDGQVVKGVPGLLTVLSDGGWSDEEILTWLFTADDTLPGRPIDALREDRGSEVKRRAQAIAL